METAKKPSAVDKYLSQICLWAGFLLPFVASKFVGMPISRRPLIATANVLLWAAGLVIGYLAHAKAKPVSSDTPWWNRVAGYITSMPATLLTLGIVFGYLYYPSVQNNVVTRSVNYLLMVTLFVMGAQIRVADWKGVFRYPKAVFVSVLIRWVTMPLFSYVLAKFVLLKFFPQPTATLLAIGLIVLGTTPTGAASNTLTLISRGDLALSVSVTTANTILAPFLQPFLIMVFVGSATHVNTFGIFMDLIKYVLIPVLAGSMVGAVWPQIVKGLKPVLTAISVICLALIIMGNISKGTATLLRQLWILPLLITVCVVYGTAGLCAGYFGSKLFGFSRKQRIAACFEVGVENAALTQVLLINHFAPLTVIPAVLYSKIQHLLAIGIFVSRFQKFPDEATSTGTIEASGPIAAAKAATD